MRYDKAREIAETGKPRVMSYSGGKSRYAHFTLDGDAVNVRLFDTRIARIEPDRVTIWMGGHNTVTTREVLNSLVPPSISIYNEDKVTYVADRFGGRRPFEEGMTFYTIGR